MQDLAFELQHTESLMLTIPVTPPILSSTGSLKGSAKMEDENRSTAFQSSVPELCPVPLPKNFKNKRIRGGMPLLSANVINHNSHSKKLSSPRSPTSLRLNVLDPLGKKMNSKDEKYQEFNSQPLLLPNAPKTDSFEASEAGLSEAIVVDLDISKADTSPTLIKNFETKLKLSDKYESQILLDKDISEFSGAEWKVIAEAGKLDTLEVLGEGNGGSVKKCRLGNSKSQIFALKTITTDPSPEFQKQIVRELNYNRRFKSPYIVKYYGAFLNEQDASICICMEYMGGRSLDAIYKTFKKRDGRIGEKPLGKVAERVLKGLSYLNQQKIMHRDIKPQNILLDVHGNVKLCDFGVSGEVVNSLATTFTGTSFYMAPERIRNEPYTISCDVWSLGLTLLEGAMGNFPFTAQSSNLEISPIDLLLIILEFQPNLQDEPEEGIHWSTSFKDFIKVCLTKEGRKRPSPRQMLEHPWIRGQMRKKVKMEKLVEYCWGT